MIDIRTSILIFDVFFLIQDKEPQTAGYQNQVDQDLVTNCSHYHAC